MALREVHRFVPEEPAITKGGTWRGSFNFDGTIQQIIVRPTNASTIYNIGIIDDTGMPIFRRIDHKGLLISPNEGELGLIVFPGEKTILIEDASRDEIFDIKIVWQK